MSAWHRPSHIDDLRPLTLLLWQSEHIPFPIFSRLLFPLLSYRSHTGEAIYSSYYEVRTGTTMDMSMLISPAWLLCKHGGLYVLLLLLVVNSFCRTSYLKIYATDLRQIFTGTWQPIFVVYSRNGFAGRMRLVAPPDRLTLGIVLHVQCRSVYLTSTVPHLDSQS